MKKKMSKTKKQILALGMLALGGLTFGSLSFVPYLLRHWSTIQYEVVNFKSEFDQNEKKFTLGFELSDLDAYKLKYQPLQVKLYSDSNGKSMVSEHTAHYDDFSRSWKLDVDASQLTPGSRYYIGIDYKEGKNRFGAKKIVGFSKNIADFINVPAAVKSINFGKIDTGSALVKVNFSDDIKSLEGKKVALEYYYLPKGQKVATKNQIVTTYVDLTTVKEGSADFQLNNLLSNADYYVSGVKLVSDGQTPRELTSNKQQDIRLNEGKFFSTEVINLEVSQMKATDELDLGKSILLTFDKNANPNIAEVNNMPVEISYVNKTSKEHEIKIIRTKLIDNIINFHLNRENNHLLPLGSGFEITQIKISGTNIKFKKGVSNVFYSQNGVVAIKSKTSGTTANVEATFASQDDISGLIANVDLSPLAKNEVIANIVPLENNLYKATFNITGLTNRTVYNINSISLNKLPTKTIFTGGEFDYRKFNFEDGVEHSFLTGLDDLSVFIKAAPQIETNLVTYSFGFGIKSSYLNSKQLRLAYHLEGDGRLYYSQVATAIGNAVNFKLNEFLPGRKYKLDNIEIVGEPNINVIIDGDQEEKFFYTKATVSDIEFEDIDETTAKVKVFIQSDLEQWQKIKDIDAGKATLIYSAGAHNSLVLSTNQKIEPSKLVQKNNGFELEFDLKDLNRKTNYYIDSLTFSNPLVNALFSADGILALNKFFTTKFKNASVLAINTYNISQHKASIEIRFNPDTDSFLNDHKFRLILKKNDQPIELRGESTKKIENEDPYVGEVKSSSISFNLTDLDAGSKYTIDNLVAVEKADSEDATQFKNLHFNFQNPNIKSSINFYTRPDIINIQTESIDEQKVKVKVQLETQDNSLNYTSNISLAYLNKSTNVLEFATGAYNQSDKQFIFNLGETNPLQKVTDYEIERVVAQQDVIPFATSFHQNDKKFSTSAKTAQIVAVQQVGHFAHELKVVLNFSNNDSYLNGEKLQVELKEKNGSIRATAMGTVQNNSAQFDFSNLTKAGEQYLIGQILHIVESASKVKTSIGFGYNATAESQKDKLYTLGNIKTITYGAKQPHSAEVNIEFNDVEKFLDAISTTKTTRQAVLKYKDNNDNIFSSIAQITQGRVRFNLTQLREFTTYTIESLEISQIGVIEFSEQAQSQKNFYTKVATISLNDAIYVNKTPTKTDATLVFNSNDKKVINGKEITVVLSENGKIGTATDKQASANIVFNKYTNRYEAKLHFIILEPGSRYNLKTLKISGTQDDPSAQPNSVIDVDISKITNEQKNSFATTGVTEHIRLNGNVSDTEARIDIQFKGDLKDKVAGFEGRNATLVYKNRLTNKFVSNTQIIKNNEAHFVLSNLSKEQTYEFVSLKLDGTRELDVEDYSNGVGHNVNEVPTFRTSFHNVEIIDIQQKVEKDKTIVSVFFDPDVDEFAINNYQATLEYTPKTGSTQKISSQPVDISNFRAVFELQDSILQEVSAFDINAVVISTKNSHNQVMNTTPTATFSNTLNTKYASKKVFYSSPKITQVTKNITDSTAHLTIKVNQPENTYTGNNVDALLVFKSKRTKTTNVKLIKGVESQINGVEKTFEFDLTGLDKLTTYEIEELRINGNVIEFNKSINANSTQKEFQTTATNVETPSFVQTIENKSEVAANILFDPVKDWYLIGNKISFTAVVDGHSKTFETTVGSDGLATLDIKSDAAHGFVISAGQNITFSNISIVNEQHVPNLTNLTTLINPSKFTKDENNGRTVALSLKTKDLITNVVNKTLSANSAQIELKIATSKPIVGNITLNYLNKQNGNIQKVQAQAPTTPNSGNITFNIHGQAQIQNLINYQLQNVEANGEIIGFDTDTVTNENRQFRTLPDSINVKSITTTYDQATKTAIARVEFDDTARQFLVGKKVKISYHPLLNSISANASEATTDANGSEATIRLDGSAELKLDGSLMNGVHNIAINGVPGRATGTNTLTNTNSSLQGTSSLTFTNAANKLIDGIKYQITKIDVLDTSIHNFQTNLQLTNSDDSEFSTLPISTYAYQVQTSEVLNKVDATIEAFYLTNQTLRADQATAEKFAISLYNQTNNTAVNVKADKFEATSPSVVPLNLQGNTSQAQGQQYFWKIIYKVDLEKASLYKIVSTSYDGKDIPLSQYTDAHSQQTLDNQLKQFFTTPGTKTKVVGIEYNPIPFENKATIKIQLDDVDGFVRKNHLQLKLSYIGVAGSGVSSGSVTSSTISADEVATFEITGLARASRYQIEKIELVGHDAIVAKEGLKIETVATGHQQASDFAFTAKTTNSTNQTLFSTRNEATSAIFTQTPNVDGAGTLTIDFAQTGNEIASKQGIVTFVEESNGVVNKQEILANSNSVFSNNKISFNLTNLKKWQAYKIKKVTIGGLDYFMTTGHDVFHTMPQIAKIVDIQYSNLESVLTSDQKLAGRGTIKIIFDTLEDYLVGKTLNLHLSTTNNLTKDVTGQVKQDGDSNPYIQINLDDNNFKSNDSQANNIVVGKEWTIESISIVNNLEFTNVRFPITGDSRSQRADGTRGLENLKRFKLPGYFSNITLSESPTNNSSTIDLKSVHFDGDISHFQGKQVVVELDSNKGHEYYATANINGTNLSFNGLKLNGLTGLTEHHISKIKIDGVSYPISPETSSTNVAYTNAEYFTVNQFEYVEASSRADQVQLKVTFDPKDSWLLGKQVVIDYKSVLPGNLGSHWLSNNQRVSTISSTSGNLEAIFNVPVNDQANDFESSFDFKQHYEFLGVKLVNFDIHNPALAPYNQKITPVAHYAPSLGLGTENVRFYTQYKTPSIKDTNVSEITNIEGKLNTFQATVTVNFDYEAGIATSTVNTWEIKFFKDWTYVDEIQKDKFQIINKRWDMTTHSFKFDIVGDLKDLIDNFKDLNRGHDRQEPNYFYMQMSYKYFQDPSKTNLKDSGLTNTMNHNTINLDAAFPAKYVEITQIRGTQTSAYDYGIDIDVYDPFDIIKVTNKTREERYQQLYKTIYNNGKASGRKKNSDQKGDGIGEGYFDKNGIQKNTLRSNKILAIQGSQTRNSNFWKFQNQNIQMNFGIKLDAISKVNQSILNLSQLNSQSSQQQIQDAILQAPTPLNENSHFRPKVQIVNLSTNTGTTELNSSHATTNILDISYYNEANTNNKYSKSPFSKHKRIWLNISSGEYSYLAGKALVLDFNSFNLIDTTSNSNAIKLLIPKNDDNLQKIFVMPSTGNHIQAFWGTYTNNVAMGDASHPEQFPNRTRVTIEGADFFKGRDSSYNAFQAIVSGNTILGPSPFLAPFKDGNHALSYWDVNAQSGFKNDLRIYNFGNVAQANRQKTYTDNKPRYISSQYQVSFGVSNTSYDDATGELTVTFDWAKQKNGKHKLISTIMPHKAYAAYVDNNGNLYYFGKTNADGAALDQDLGPDNDKIIFSTRQLIYKTSDNPAPNSRLFFVGILVQPYGFTPQLLSEKLNYLDINVRINRDLKKVRVVDKGSRYKRSADGDVTVAPGIFDILKFVNVSKTYPVPILTKAAQDSIQSIIYK